MDIIILKIEFKVDSVIIDDKYEYSIYKNKFEIKNFGEKKFILNGDVDK